ncbi:ABC transporter permease [Roseimaritima ulvae]|uniref:Ribose transport system permease protein RbsC n=1 Tax=Roseimaritima ulvae TaxID=980254 RepID=A0A5B9R1G1_9BACT|nr:ABC transporter permease [Roseimaritima ulvae]QEG40153.1 Ribose transport system permease protein RbsC [Roseimaritima ulvae]
MLGKIKTIGMQLGPLIALLVIFFLFTIADWAFSEGYFLSFRNIRVMLSSAALIAVPAFGMTIIIIAAGIDLSAGTALTLCGTVLALQLKNAEVAAGDPGFAGVMISALLLTILAGCLCGLFNGMLISLTHVVPFIVTLGTMTIFLGVGQIISGESTVYAPKENIPLWLKYLCYTGSDSNNYLISGVPIPSSVLIATVLAILVGLLMRYTVFGRNVFAIGSSESTARLCGINVPAMIVAVYTLAGFFVAIGGLLYFADVKNGNPTDGTGKELEIIAAVVLGGGSLSGGRGSILGTVVGALIITVIRSGCSQLSIPNTYTHIIIGAIIIVAVIVDQLRHGSPEWFFRMLPQKSNDAS